MSANALGGEEKQTALSITTTTVPPGQEEFIDEFEELFECNEAEIKIGDRVTLAITSNTKSVGGGKNANERKPNGVISTNCDEKSRTELDSEVSELLGSVIMHNCTGTRASARVIQKMKQDQTRPLTPPNERDPQRREDKTMQKTPSQLRSNKPTWTNLERNHFFDALNEFGKDFDALGNYINTKLKRRSAADSAFKTKEQVRQHYYQTYHKICKYIKFSDEVKKPAQELYALINYGEMRRKLQFVTDKHFMKLRNLVYHGHISVRCKGKNLRIKTPSCKALRRLNQLDDSLEDIKLPSKIEVIVSPATMEAFGRVQTVAQNPRVRTTVPLHKKLFNFIKTFQMKWRSAEQKMAEEELKLFPTACAPTPSLHSSDCNGQQTVENIEHLPAFQDPEMCFLPKPGVPIHRPLLSITEYLGSGNICLTAYEERMGVKVRGETLSQDRSAHKRPRTESGSEKRSPDSKKNKLFNSPPYEKLDSDGPAGDIVYKDELGALYEQDLLIPGKCESSSDELSDELQELLGVDLDSSVVLKEGADNSQEELKMPLNTSDITINANTTFNQNQNTANNQARMRRAVNARGRASASNFKPLISEAVIRRIRKGWTISTTADITIGDLYVVLGQDSKLELDYYWTDRQQQQQQPSVNSANNSNMLLNPSNMQVNSSCNLTFTGAALESMTQSDTKVFMQKQNGMPYNPSECDDPDLLKSLSNAGVANKLKHLLLIANLSERMRKRQCSCGHTCERNVAKTRIERNIATKTYVSTKTFSTNNNNESNNVFRQPVAPIRRPLFNMDSVKPMNPLSRQKQSMRQTLVQRMLLPGGSTANQSYDVLKAKNIENARENSANNSVQPNSNIESHTSPASNDLSPFKTMSEVSTSVPLQHNPPPTSSNSSPFTSITNNHLDEVAELDNNPSTSAAFKMADVTANNTDLVGRFFQSSAVDNTDISLSSSFPDSAFDETTNTSSLNGMTPTHLLRESTSNSRWLEENINDFSLTSLLGHLDEINATRDILDPSSSLSVISESSVDYMHKFQEITALMQSQDKD
ncbi:protein cramped [Zeugodacus cucurbitae]|uniref:protein cramped n=1 Tax=Zeugodacus cucurbitae TaxID=28588 RepID=UPI0023D93DCD|nr:protein cramped [Zeugodacus cucurbitae]XP_028898273.2 protein cramped [Zeugodacus cucurbitae]